MNKVRTIIVDDEKKAREGLSNMLRKYEEIELIALCRNGLEAIDCLQNHQVDFMFLDIQMPGIDGFDVLNSISDPKPFVVFVTAFDQYAIRAFEHHALDYLLKPFSNDRFSKSLNRALNLIGQQQNKKKMNDYSGLMEFLFEKAKPENNLISNTQRNFKKLVFRCNGKICILSFNDIYWIEGYDYYIKIHSSQGTHLLKESLKNLMTKLPEYDFIRVHKSAIVNINQIIEMAPMGHNDYELLLSNNTKVRASRNYKATLLKKLNLD